MCHGGQNEVVNGITPTPDLSHLPKPIATPKTPQPCKNRPSPRNANLNREIKGVDLPRPFPRLTYSEAMARYGSDKPDTRFILEFADVSQAVADCGFRCVLVEGGILGG